MLPVAERDNQMRRILLRHTTGYPNPTRAPQANHHTITATADIVQAQVFRSSTLANAKRANNAKDTARAYISSYKIQNTAAHGALHGLHTRMLYYPGDRRTIRHLHRQLQATEVHVRQCKWPVRATMHKHDSSSLML
jgi:hypothetical protein